VEEILLYDIVYAEFFSPFLAINHHLLGLDEIKLASTQESDEREGDAAS
jgi:hypothetical protein